MCVGVAVRACVKRPVLPPSVVDGRFRNPLYYYYTHTHTYFCVREPVPNRPPRLRGR